MIDEQKLLEWIESHKYYTALPVDNFLKPRKPLYTFVDPDELISEIKSGTLTPTASAEGCVRKGANRFGVDCGYFEEKLSLVLRDLDDYTPGELSCELLRLSNTAQAPEVRDE